LDLCWGIVPFADNKSNPLKAAHIIKPLVLLEVFDYKGHKMLGYKYYIDRVQRELICIFKKLYSACFPYRGLQKTILVVGAQRSGTNLLMDVLERHLSTDVYHERDDRAFTNYLMKPLDIIKALKKQSNTEFFVIKGLCESHRTTELLKEFQPAKAIWVVRDFNDVVNSMDISFKETKDIIKKIADDRYSGGWRTEAMSDDTYHVVKSLVHDGLSNKSASALQWYIRNVIFFENKFDSNKDIKLLNYNDLVVSSKEVLQKISDFSGLAYNQNMDKIINSHSIKKNKEPIIDEGIRKVCSELWGRFMSLSDSAKI
jgi:hypothetical protein